jgi:Ca-activated chloride channel family protein
MFRFEHIEYFILLLIIPVFAGLIIFQYFKRKRDLKAIGDPELINSLMPDYSQFRRNLKAILMILALILLIAGIAGPQFGSRLTEVKHEGIEIIIALDVSNSMMAEDIQPNRLERAKQELSKLMDKLENDRFGLIVFAGDAYTQIPITNDYLSAKMFLAGINTNMVSRQGTALGSAIELAVKSFSPLTKASKVIIVISDGENHEGDVQAACKKAVESGIKIFTIGMGLPQGARIPMNEGPYNQDFRRDKEGNFVVTRLNEQMLVEISTAGDGRYYRADAPGMGLNSMLTHLRKLDKAEMEYKIYSEFEEQFPVFIWIAFGLLWLDYIILDRKNKWLKKIQLFS